MVATAAALMEVKVQLRCQQKLAGRLCWFLTRFCLMQTLCKLHNSARAAHLDISPGNVMVTCNPVNEWDRLRVLDMGISQGFRPGVYLKILHTLHAVFAFALMRGCAPYLLFVVFNAC